MKTIYTAIALLACTATAGRAAAEERATRVAAENVSVATADGSLNISADFVLDSLSLRSNSQIFITPVVRGWLFQPLEGSMADNRFQKDKQAGKNENDDKHAHQCAS